MKTKLLNFFVKLASWKSVLLFFALQMIFSIYIIPAFSGSSESNLPTLDLQFYYTPERAYEIIESYTPAMRQAAAITRLTLDIIYPLTYGMMLTLLLTLTFRRAFAKPVIARERSDRSNLSEQGIATSDFDELSSPRNDIADWSVFIPWGGVLFDYLENVCFATMFLSYPQEYLGLAFVAGIFTALKWTLIGVSFVLPVIGGVKLAFAKTKK